jgi:hypothetical protein
MRATVIYKWRAANIAIKSDEDEDEAETPVAAKTTNGRRRLISKASMEGEEEATSNMVTLTPPS